jgi:V-type H+-transporting ATPase subunit H
VSQQPLTPSPCHLSLPIPPTSQSWGDEDIPELLTSLSDRLKEGITVLSSFDKYKKEVLSGSLDWGPMHTSEVFWRANVEAFEDKDFQVLRVLLKLLEASREVRWLQEGGEGCMVEWVGTGRRGWEVGSRGGGQVLLKLLEASCAVRGLQEWWWTTRDMQKCVGGGGRREWSRGLI